MPKWKQRDPDIHCLDELVAKNVGISIEKFLNPEADPPIKYLEDAVAFTKICVSNGMDIKIVGDYDCDGVMSTIILKMGITEYTGVTPAIRLPRRFSEGYGLSMKIIDETAHGLIITVDNGIAAIEEIKAAKEKGLSVIVLDHHLPQRDADGNVLLPDADVLVDPHVDPDGWYTQYCGAGLAYRFIKALNPESQILEKLEAFAGVATVADVMRLTGDNRNLVLHAIEEINARKVTTGFHMLLDELKISFCTEDDFGFLIGPCINASGRLYDNGPADVVELLSEDRNMQKLSTEETTKLHSMALELVCRNEERKELVREEMDVASKWIQNIWMNKPKAKRKVIVLYDPSYNEGIIGIIAGHPAEQYHVPALVFTNTAKAGELKGSGRNGGVVHLERLLKSVQDAVLGFGGHWGAAGLSIKENRLSELEEKLIQSLDGLGFVPPKNDTVSYDLEIQLKDIPQELAALSKFAPFGEGNQKPVYLVKGFESSPIAGKFNKLMGRHDEHIKLYGKEVSALLFHKSDRYIEEGEPKVIDVIGCLSQNYYKGRFYPQIEVEDYRAVTQEKTDFFQQLNEIMVY
uniref:single-stranded-DNA-specific exonuclease RecJ n=1 Tax=Lachnoclostridium phocaeense TaxID=1871021 RepID=UPI0026DB1AED|nr:DHH family phosphoesterase [Lachnoclostridium phocaeense]